MKHILAPLDGFETLPAIEAMLREMNLGHDARATKRFSIRYLRYWFIRNVLDQLHRQLGRPLRVLEVGIGEGKMLGFMGGPEVAPGRQRLPAPIAKWDALSAEADPRVLERFSYSSFMQVDLDRQFEPPVGNYDAIVALHVLEHLRDPETVLRRLLPCLRKDGVLTGGSPTMPSMLAGLHERFLRRKYAAKLDDVRAHKHLSVITPRRVRKFANLQGLTMEMLAGAFLLRSSNNPLEDRRWWVRANLAWGAAFPALGGEIYFALRRTALVAALALFSTGLAAIEVA